MNCEFFDDPHCKVGLRIGKPVIEVNPWGSCELFANRTPADPCETCLRWPECNGVDADTCLLRKLLRK